LLVVLAVALLAAVPGLRAVLREIRHIGLGWIAVAVALELASATSFVVVFRLFFDRLDVGDARALAWTAQGSGALLPGGDASGLAIGGWSIALTGAPLRWIVRRSAGLFFLSAGVSGATLVGAGLALMAGAPGPHGPSVVVPTVLVAVGLLLVAALPAILRARPHEPGWLAAIATGVREAEQTTLTRRPSWRLVGALGYLAFDIAVLWVTLRAIGHAPSVAVVTLGYSIGYAANSLPIPGGIGVLDAGLTGALVLYGVPPVHAAAAVIVYHAIAFWIPGLGGVLAYLRLRPRLRRTDAPHPHTLNQHQTLSPATRDQGSGPALMQRRGSRGYRPAAQLAADLAHLGARVPAAWGPADRGASQAARSREVDVAERDPVDKGRAGLG
jgi:uncharacterized membrane protein YbhN (UPF0104 family)